MSATPQAERLQPHAWSKITLDNYILNLIHKGIPLHFHSRHPSFMIPNRPFSQVQAEWIRAEIHRLLVNNCIRLVHTPPTCVSPIFVVPKAGDEKFRLIFDLSTLNTYLFESPSVRYGGYAKFQQIFCHGDQAIK